MKWLPLYSKLATLFLNFFCIVTGIIYLVYPNNSHFWNFAGIVYILTILINSSIVLHVGKKVNPEMKIVKRFRIASYGYYFFVAIAYFLIFFANFIGYGPNPSSNIAIGLMIGVGYFGILLYPSFLIVFSLLKFDNEMLDYSKNITSEIKSLKNVILLILRAVIVLIGVISLSLGILVDITIINPNSLRFLGFGLGVFAAQTGLFFGLGCLSSTFLILYTVRRYTKFFKTKIISISVLGFTIAILCFVPLFSTPSFSAAAFNDFSEAYNPYFGGSWETTIDSSGFKDFFLKNPFQLTGYFLGGGNPSCVIIPDILYFDGSTSNYSVDQNIQLFFDAYLPPNSGAGLPGENSTIIRIHGGGWVLGDKNLMNIRMMNRYLAAQGYCVFDIQYGLNNVSNLMGGFSVGPEYVFGNFTLDDIMRHVGNFTLFLETHSSEYGSNLNSVFISGGSAGGQLTCAVALSIDSGNYTSTFSNAMTIKGLIPYYPANNITADFAVGSKVEWVDPNLLVVPDSPPSLIFQGAKDNLIRESLRFQKTYSDLGRSDCAVLIFPFAGHANDLYFPGYYNQVFLYYMERFLYLFH